MTAPIHGTEARTQIATIAAVQARCPVRGDDDDHECEPASVTYAARSYGVRVATTWCACGNDIDTFLTTFDPEDAA